jgi:hypothetical protein
MHHGMGSSWQLCRPTSADYEQRLHGFHASPVGELIGHLCQC